MANRQTKYTDYLGLPVERDTKRRLKKIADAEERSPTEMARIILREGIERHEAAALDRLGPLVTATAAEAEWAARKLEDENA